MNLSQSTAGHVGVYLRGREVGVAQHHLHRPQVGPALEQVGRETVPEGVGRDVLLDPGGLPIGEAALI